MRDYQAEVYYATLVNPGPIVEEEPIGGGATLNEEAELAAFQDEKSEEEADYKEVEELNIQ